MNDNPIQLDLFTTAEGSNILGPEITGNKIQDLDDVELLRSLVVTLWDLLDHIDTASDMAKSNDEVYRSIVEKVQHKRWETGIKSDGYDLFI